mgnify:CR=1 FL=1|jgi:chromate transporter
MPQIEAGAESGHRVRTLFTVFFKISMVAVGGGLAMLPLISREFVEKRNWMTDKEMVDVIAVMQSMPGIIAINMAVLVGYRTAGFWGAVSAAFGVVTPPFVVIVIVAAFISFFRDNRYMNHIFLGIRAAVCALILLSVIKLSRSVLKNRMAVILALAAFGGLVFLEFNVIWMIVGGAAIGLALGVCHLLLLKTVDVKKEDGK